MWSSGCPARAPSRDRGGQSGLWPCKPGCITRGSGQTRGRTERVGQCGQWRWTPISRPFKITAIYFVGADRGDDGGSKQTRTADPLLVRQRQTVRRNSPRYVLPGQSPIHRRESQIPNAQTYRPIRRQHQRLRPSNRRTHPTRRHTTVHRHRLAIGSDDLHHVEL
jgi:hypothetical protein